MTRMYTLPPAEIERVRGAGGPLADMADLSRVAQDMKVTVVEIDGAIVAYWVLFTALHAEPLWVKAEWRRSPSVINGIVQAMLQEAARTTEPAIFSLVEPANAEVVGEYARRLGFEEVPGTLFYKMIERTVPET